MTRLAWALLAVAMLACSSSPSGDRASIERIELVVPSGWAKHDMSTHRRAIAEWRPSGENHRKESITVIAARAANAKLTSDELRSLLEKAQAGLSAAAFGSPTAFSTKQGLAGFRIEGTFVPSGQTQPYHRIHAAVLDGTSIVHVLYTARDAAPENLELVVDSLVRKGA